MSPPTRAKPRPPDRPSISVRPLPDPEHAVEVHTHCRHGGYRIGYRLDELITERIAVTCALFHHAAMLECRCMDRLWPKYRAEHAPADLEGASNRFQRVWDDVQDRRRRQGYAVINWGDAVDAVSGKAAS